MANEEVTVSLSAENTWKSSPVTGVTMEACWKEAVNKIYHPDQYLPVTDVMTKQNADGSVWRTMRIIPMNQTIVETITASESDHTIRFHVLDADGNKTTRVHFNVLKEEAGGITIDYYELDTATNAKTPLKGTGAILKIAANARAACRATK